jgi:hypothetical protein
MKILMIFGLFSVLLFGGGFIEGANTADCDVEASVKVQGMFSSMGCSWTTTRDTVKFKWGSDWDHYDKKTRLKMTEIAANADACLSGKARSIRFYRRDVLVGEASPISGIKLK